MLLEDKMKLGAANGLSKSLTPAHYGETIENPVVTTLLLRAWMLWRIGNEWPKVNRSRQRQFEEEKETLKLDIEALQPTKGGGGLLGSKKANTLLANWVPDICKSF